MHYFLYVVALLLSSIECSLAIICRSGVQNFNSGEVNSVTCSSVTQRCYRTEYIVDVTNTANPTNFRQTSYGCVLSPRTCNSAIRCDSLSKAFRENNTPGLTLSIRDCSTSCCNTDNCNAQRGLYAVNSGSRTTVPPTISTLMVATTTSTLARSSATISSNPVNQPGSNMCYSGVINFATKKITQVACKTKCLTNDIDVNAATNGISFSFHQTSFSCASSLDDCDNQRRFCNTVRRELQKALPISIDVSVINCRNKCCTKSLCNARDPSLTYKRLDGHILPNADFNVAATTARTVETITTTTIAPTTTNTNVVRRPLSCYSGAINFAVNRPLTKVSCSTACLTNEIDVNSEVNGFKYSFHQTVFSCVSDVAECNDRKRYCDGVRSDLEKAGLKVSVVNCKIKCCSTPLCNTRNPSLAYKRLDGHISQNADLFVATTTAIRIPTTVTPAIPSLTTISRSSPTFCYQGAINFAVKGPLKKVFCQTSCLTNELDINSEAGGTKFSFHQTSFSCASTADECDNTDRTCNAVRSELRRSGLDVTVLNCQIQCCSTSLCNARDPSMIYKQLPGHIAPNNMGPERATTTVKSTTSTATTTQRPAVTTTVSAQNNQLSSISCYKGEIMFSKQLPLKKVFCTTACLNNELDVNADATGVKLSFHHSTFGCAETLSDCYDNDRFCNEQLINLKDEILLATNISIINCRNKCCQTSLCNVRDPTLTYKLSTSHAKPNGEPGEITTAAARVIVAVTTTPMPAATTETTTKSALITTVGNTNVVNYQNPKTCYSGSISFLGETISEVPCRTACLSSEVDLKGSSFGNPFSLHMTVFACADNTQQCADDDQIFCKSVKPLLKQLDTGMSITNITLQNCKISCCSTSLCNVKDPFTSYQLYFDVSGVNSGSVNSVTSTVSSRAITATSGGSSGKSLTRCYSGAVNFATEKIQSVKCTTACLTSEQDVHFNTGSGTPISFKQMTFACAPSLSVCIGQSFCRLFGNSLQNLDISSSVRDLEIRNCRTKCCTTTHCNAKDPSAKFELNSIPSSGGVDTGLDFSTTTSLAMKTTTAATTVTTTVTTPVATTLATRYNNNAKPIVCYSGIANFDTITRKPVNCTTACLTNEVDVDVVAQEASFSFHQSTYSCATSLADCYVSRLCDAVASDVKGMDLGLTVSSIKTKNCNTKCCNSSYCNSKSSTNDYELVMNP